jgi:hypothetical protein
MVQKGRAPEAACTFPGAFRAAFSDPHHEMATLAERDPPDEYNGQATAAPVVVAI